MLYTADVFSTDDYLEFERNESVSTEYVISGEIVFRKTDDFKLETESDSPNYEEYRRMAIDAWYAATGNWRVATVKRLNPEFADRYVEMLREHIGHHTVLSPRELRVGDLENPASIQFYYSNDVESWLIVLSKRSAKNSAANKERFNN